MPVTVEGKLELFKRILFEHVEEDWSDKRKKVAEAVEERLEEKRKDYEKQRKAILDDAKNRAEMKRKNIISKAQGDAQQEIMRKKQELFCDITEHLKTWTRKFIEDDGYKEFLSKNINQALNLMEGQNLIMNFTQKDVVELGPFIKEQIVPFANLKDIEIAVSKEDLIGGFIVEDRVSGLIADFSIKNLIGESKEFMGKLLYERLDEVLKA